VLIVCIVHQYCSGIIHCAFLGCEVGIKVRTADKMFSLLVAVVSRGVNECAASMICQSGRSADAVSEEVKISVAGRSQSSDQFDIHGSATSSPRNFAYKVDALHVN